MTNPKSLPDAVERVDTAELRKLLEKATPGPWQVNGVRGKLRKSHGEHIMETHDIGPDGDALASVFFNPKTGLGFADAKLIVAAVNALPAILSQLDKLETENARLLLSTRGDPDGRWPLEVRDAVDALEDQYGISLCSSAFAEKHNRLREAAEAGRRVAEASYASLVGARDKLRHLLESEYEGFDDEHSVILRLGWLRSLAELPLSPVESGFAAADNNRKGVE